MNTYGQVTRRSPPRWLILVLLLCAALMWTLGYALDEIGKMEREIRRIEPGVVIVRPTPELRDDIAACHRRIDAIDATIVAIEARRGNEPPRLLQEQRAYRARGWDNSPKEGK